MDELDSRPGSEQLKGGSRTPQARGPSLAGGGSGGDLEARLQEADDTSGDLDQGGDPEQAPGDEGVADAEANGATPALDADRADFVIDFVDVRARRMLVARLLIGVMAADRMQLRSEKVLLAPILDRWSLTPDAVLSPA